MDKFAQKENNNDNRQSDRPLYENLQHSNQSVKNRRKRFYSVICTKSISKLISLLITWIGCGLILSILLYRGTFFLWQYPLSDLGSLITVNGKPNIKARLIFDATMGISGLLMIGICTRFKNGNNLIHNKLKSIMAFISAIGFFLMIIPDDLSDPLHEIGATLVFAMLWSLTVLLSKEIGDTFTSISPVIPQLILQGTILPYAVLFFLHIPFDEIIQKFAVAGLMAAIWLSTRIYHQPKEQSVGV